MPRNPYFSAIQVRKPRVHVRSQEWGTGHRRTSTDSGGVTCALGRRRTAGQAAGPESEEWAPDGGRGMQDVRMAKAGVTNTHAQVGNVFLGGRAMRIPGMRGVGRDARCKPRGRPGGAKPQARGQGSLPYRCNPSEPAR